MAINILWKDRKRYFGLPISFTVYKMSEDRLFIKKGIFNIKEDEVRLYRILDVGLKRSLWQRIFRVGSIDIHSSDKSLKDFEIQSVANSRDVMEMLSVQVEQQREAKRVVSREYMSHDDDGEVFDEDN